MLEEDDLELLEENTGASFSRNRLTRLRRARDSESPPAPSSSKRKAVVESSDEDLDNDDLELPAVQDIQNIWDDERNAGGRDDDDDMDDDMDNFIEYEDEEEEAGGTMDEEAREARRRERRRQEKARRRALGRAAELGGIDAKCVHTETCYWCRTKNLSVRGTSSKRCSEMVMTMTGPLPKTRRRLMK